MSMLKMGDRPGCCGKSRGSDLVVWAMFLGDGEGHEGWVTVAREQVSFCLYCGAELHGDGSFTPRRTPKAGTVTFDAKSMVWVAAALKLAWRVMAETPAPMSPKQAQVVEALYALHGPGTDMGASEQDAADGRDGGTSKDNSAAPAMTRWERLPSEDRVALLDALTEEAGWRRGQMAHDAEYRELHERLAGVWEAARAALMRPDTVTSKDKSAAEYQAEVAACDRWTTPPERQGIYIASKTKHASRWLALRAQGCPIVSTWIDEAGVGETSDWRGLWDRCLSEAAGAAALVMYVEPGESHKGSLAEVGAALWAGVPVFWVGPEIGTVRRHRGVTVCDTLELAMEAARNAVLQAARATS